MLLVLWLNVVLLVLILGVQLWFARRLRRFAPEHLTTALRAELVASVRAELAAPVHPPANPPDEWTPAKSARRSELIDREIDEVITPDEARELDALQEEAARYGRRVAPRPLEALEALHQQLLEKASKAGKA